MQKACAVMLGRRIIVQTAVRYRSVKFIV